MKPRRQIVIHCPDLVEAQHIAFVLGVRLHLRCTAVARYADIAKHPTAELVVFVSDGKPRSYQRQINRYCRCQALVWHRARGVSLAELMEAVHTMVVMQEVGPVGTVGVPGKTIPAVKVRSRTTENEKRPAVRTA